MTLSYPIARNALEALSDPVGHERTEAAALRSAGVEVKFDTEWLRPTEDQADELAGAVQSGVMSGAIQLYEGEKGQPVLAVSYWRVVSEAEKILDQPDLSKTPGKKEDHADDLYFRHGRTRKKKKDVVDPNQMDLFGPAAKPDQAE